MSGFKLSLCVALAATPLAAGAESQPCVACFAAVPVHPAAPAVAQVPVAAVRQHLLRREAPPPIVDHLISTTYRAIVADYRARRRKSGRT